MEKDEQGNIKEIAGGVKDNQQVKICGIISNRKNKITKSNSQMAFLRLEDLFGTIEVIVFPKVLQAYGSAMTEGSAVVIEGRVSIREDEEPKILCESLVSLDGVTVSEKPAAEKKPEIDTKRRTLFVRMGTMDDAVLKMATELLKAHRGTTPVCFSFRPG